MSDPDARQELIREYVAGVRSVLTPPAASGGERGAAGLVSSAALAEDAERLDSASHALTSALAADLTGPDPAVRVEASTRLLAKALTDLEVSAFIYQAAQDEEEGLPGGGEAERGGAAGASEERLAILLGKSAAPDAGLERGFTPPVDVPSARVELTHQIDDTLALISRRAQGAGQEAISGLLGLGVTELGKGVVIVGADLARVVGQAERATRLYDLFRGFVANAYSSVLALLGPQLAGVATKKLQELFEKVRQGEPLARLLESLYQTDETRKELDALVRESSADLARFVAAIQAVASLDASFRQQISLSEKLFKGLRFFALLPTGALPQAKVLAASAYTVLGAYVVLVGSDYVDARRLNLLNLVPGVRALVETNLSDR